MLHFITYFVFDSHTHTHNTHIIYIHIYIHIYVYMSFLPIPNMLITPHAACYIIINSTYLLLCYKDIYKQWKNKPLCGVKKKLRLTK